MSALGLNMDWPLWVLENAVLRVGITEYGGRLVFIEAPDRHGVRDHVLLGLDDLPGYLGAGSFGALLGRYANRIAGGRFSLDGQNFELVRNEGANTLHGGANGFNRMPWQVASHTPTELVLTHLSLDGDQGFPGEVAARATYRLDGGTLWLELTATTSKPTVLNLSTHPYFNLAGADALDIADHEVTIFADAFLPTDAAQIPTGEIQSVAGTPFDFRQPVRLRDRLRSADPQLVAVGGFDHCFVLGDPTPTPRLAARIFHPENGRGLEVYTTQPALQAYTSNKLNGTLVGRGGAYRQSAGLALEPQCFPDAPNRPNFPSTVLRPGATWRALSGYAFTA